jgi:hypothetical protein
VCETGTAQQVAQLHDSYMMMMMMMMMMTTTTTVALTTHSYLTPRLEKE